MQCPKCSTTLQSIEYEGIVIENCPGCQGQWLDVTELKKVVTIREKRFDPDHRRAIAEAVKITSVDLRQVDRDLQCPKCFGQTDAVNYGGDTGIIIDKCSNCDGIWLDNDELEKIQMIVEGWEDGLPDDLAKYGPRLREVAVEVDKRDDVTISSFGFINTIINGILDMPYWL